MLKFEWLRQLMERIQEHQTRQRQEFDQGSNEYLEFWRNRY
jgi:hypothetical protein